MHRHERIACPAVPGRLLEEQAQQEENGSGQGKKESQHKGGHTKIQELHKSWHQPIGVRGDSLDTNKNIL